MPRPRTIPDSAILDAALGLIRRQGSGAVTFARVAEEVELAPATLVQRFGSKRGLLQAAAAHGAPSRVVLWEQARDGTDSPLVALLEVLGSLSSPLDTREAMANSLAFLHLDLSDPELHRLAIDGMVEMGEHVRVLLDEAVAAGELRPTDTGALARAVLNTYNGALISWAIYGEGEVGDWLRRELEFLLGPHRFAPHRPV